MKTNPCVIFGSFWPISHCDPPSYCDNFTAYKNKVKHFLLTVGLSQTPPHIVKVKRKCLLFVFVWGKVDATQRWFVVNLRVMWPEGSTRVLSQDVKLTHDELIWILIMLQKCVLCQQYLLDESTLQRSSFPVPKSLWIKLLLMHEVKDRLLF